MFVVPVEEQIPSTTTMEENSNDFIVDRSGQSRPQKVIPPVQRKSGGTTVVPNSANPTASHDTTVSILSLEESDDVTIEIIQQSVSQMLIPYANPNFLIFNNNIEIKRTVNGPCEAPGNMQMESYQDLFCGIPLYTEQNVNITGDTRYRARQLALLVSSIATEIFKQPAIMMKIYRDADGNDPRKYYSF